MTRLSICLQEFNSSCPTGVVLEEIDDDKPKYIASDYASDVADYVEFAREYTDKINDETEINIVVRMDDVESMGVFEFATKVVKEIRNATRDDIQ